MAALAESRIEDLLQEDSIGDRRAKLGEAGLANEIGLGKLLDRAEELVHDEPREAQALCELVDASAADLGLPAVLGRSTYLQGRIATDRGDLRVGLKLIEDSQAHWHRAGKPLEALRTDIGRMYILEDLGEHHEAIAVGERLLDAVDSATPHAEEARLTATIRAMAKENLGAALGMTGEHERAMDAYEEAHRGYVELGMDADTPRPLASRGIELLELGRAREALGDFQAAEAQLREHGDRFWEATAKGYQARAHQQLGEFSAALTALAQARETFAELGVYTEANRLQLASAETYLAIGLWDEARFEASEAAGHAESAEMSHDAARAHYLLALAHLGDGDLDAAEESLRQALQLFEKVGDRQHCARVRQAQLEVFAARGADEQARDLADLVGIELAEGGWLAALAWTQLRRVDVAVDDADANVHLERARATIAELGLPQLSEQYRLRQARLAQRGGDLETAEGLLQQAVDDANLSARALPQHALRTAFRASRIGAHDELIGLLLERCGPGDLRRAKSASRQAKAGTLRDLIAASTGSASLSVESRNEELVVAESDLAATYIALQEADAPAQRVSLSARAKDLQQRVSALRVRDSSVAFGGGGERLVERPSVEPDASGFAATVDYHVLGDDVVIFVSAGEDTHCVRAPGALPRVDDLLTQLGHQWERFAMGSVVTARHEKMLLRTAQDLLARLHDILVAPIAELLGPRGGHLQLVPHRQIGQVPFHALYDGAEYLIDQWVITTSPIPTSRVAQPKSLARPIVLAVPDERAPAVAQEARAIAELIPSARVLIGDEATSQRLAELSGADLVHFACHGAFEGDNPLFSRLRLADRWVTSTEILPLDLRDALVVLSACESGQAGLSAEPIGLGWAFLAAGASGVVSSQWMVQDEVTRHLMGSFYRAVSEGIDAATAVRSAQRATAELHPHPYYWAAFTYLSRPDLNRTERTQ